MRYKTILLSVLLILVPVQMTSAQTRLSDCVNEYHVILFKSESSTSQRALNDLGNLKEELASYGVNLVIEAKNPLQNIVIHNKYEDYLNSKGYTLTVPYLVTEEEDIFVYGGYYTRFTDDYIAKSLILQRIIDRGCKFPQEVETNIKKSKSFLASYQIIVNETRFIEYNFNKDLEGFVVSYSNYSIPFDISHEKSWLEMNVDYNADGKREVIVRKSDFLAEGTEDWSDYTDLFYDIYIPPGTPSEEIITLTDIVDKSNPFLWQTEKYDPILKFTYLVTMGNYTNRSFKMITEIRNFTLRAGTWNTIKRDISTLNRNNIIFFNIRIRFDGNTSYSGPIYIDNLRITGKNPLPKSFNSIKKRHVYKSKEDFTDAQLAYHLMKLATTSILHAEEKEMTYQQRIEEEKIEKNTASKTFYGIRGFLEASGTEFSEGDTLETYVKVNNLLDEKKNVKVNVYLDGGACILPLTKMEFSYELREYNSREHFFTYKLNKAGSYTLHLKISFDDKEMDITKDIIVKQEFVPTFNRLYAKYNGVFKETHDLESMGYNVSSVFKILIDLESKLSQANQLYINCEYEKAMKTLREVEYDFPKAIIRQDIIKKAPVSRKSNWIVIYGAEAPNSDLKLAYNLAGVLGGTPISDNEADPSDLESRPIILIGGPAANKLSNKYKDKTCTKFIKIDNDWHIMSDCKIIDNESYGFYSAIRNSSTYIIAGLSRWGTIQGYNKFITDKLWEKDIRKPGFSLRISGQGLVLALKDHLNSTKKYEPDEDGYILDWLVLSPYNSDINPDIAPNLGDGPFSSACCKNIYWREHHSEDSYVETYGIVSSEKLTSYAFTYIYSPHDQEIVLEVDSDDVIDAWLNGEKIFLENSSHQNLISGWNKLLIKLYR